MTPRARRILLAMLAVGVAGRLAVAFATYGVSFDVNAYSIVRGGLFEDPLHVYGDFDRWPYPPGYFAWILAADWIEAVAGLEFSDLIQIPPILADAAIAWLVQDELGRRGAAEPARLAAAGLVAFGPIFAVVSGYHGQLDSIAILPALGAVILWGRLPAGPRRAILAGLLIGVGAAIKTVPLVALLALLPWARSLRDAALLTASAVAIPLLAFAPWALADPDGVRTAVEYRGVPGAGGISLLVQPELARNWMNEAGVTGTGATYWLHDHGGAITAAVVLAVGAFLFRRRPDPAVGAALLYITLWAFGINFFLQYAIWGLPFLLVAGYLREVALAQLLMLPAIVLVYLRPWEESAVATVYAVASLALWVAAVAAFVLLGRSVLRRGPGLA